MAGFQATFATPEIKYKAEAISWINRRWEEGRTWAFLLLLSISKQQLEVAAEKTVIQFHFIKRRYLNIFIALPFILHSC